MRPVRLVLVGLGLASVAGIGTAWILGGNSEDAPVRATMAGTEAGTEADVEPFSVDPLDVDPAEPKTTASIVADALPAPARKSAASGKVDRLPVAPGRDRSVTASAAKPAGKGLVITTSSLRTGETVAMPVLAYADFSEQSSPFDRLIVPARPGIQQMPKPKPAILPPPVAEEDDDAPEFLPLPIRKPKVAAVDPTPAVIPVPLPLPKPHVAASAPAVAASATATTAPGAIMPRRGPLNAPEVAAPTPPPPSRPNSILALLTSATSSTPKPEVPSATPPVITRTPFGVPYVLQTESVDTACLRPELIEVLRKIESHYGKKVVITSGYRDHGRPGSLHRRCAAADIVIPGVSAQALTSFARTVPGVGGVGQYCHQSLVHVDVGTPRDWKYGCGSYFAMRDGSSSWGRVPRED
ncbi:hypothetical protein ABB55_01510 [Prosthecomicrobium hirschii]|uniref:Peptidase M15A C-terminal domain-containing protein n=1 Tax=Prosthecodimorpha hirschii TaxID=665126 RepID=A0A0P6VZ50_9HYPH|nr:D-Ala-D-Ala carboxypeptidase family metallohydrolase [Prosthecomicrobium hirschii]KPL51059.1 hypothetical protein ABB55_01510 [Prosthecomicrobium hirschii]